MSHPIEIPQSFIAYLQRRTEIVAAYLFGSVAAGKAHKFSDVDVALLLAERVDSNTAWDIRLEAMGEAEAAFGRRADVVTINEVGLVFGFQILKTGSVIYARDQGARCRFEMRLRSEYYDYQPYFEYQQSEFLRRLKSEGLLYGYHRRRRASAKTERVY
ncbi:MAG: nucleotidyltransferase domain-containing protein [Chloroflexi bacterium]|nr:nucleotidyltransferase domain-containing protein [Chloroflexota bacterium]